MLWSSPSLVPVQLVLHYHRCIPVYLFKTAVRKGRIAHVQLAFTYDNYDLHKALQVEIGARKTEMVYFLLQNECVWVRHKYLLGWLAEQGNIDGLQRLFTLEDVYIVVRRACRYAHWSVIEWVMTQTEIPWDRYESSFARAACASESIPFLEKVLSHIQRQ